MSRFPVMFTCLVTTGVIMFRSNSIGLRCIESEREQLVEFKEGLIDRLGNLSSWVGLDCCKWRGIILGDPIPMFLGMLNNLRYLNLYGSGFSGEIPPTLGIIALAELTTLVLINCLVGPSFPVWLQVQAHLFYVILSNAGISDTIEEEWFARSYSGQRWGADAMVGNFVSFSEPDQRQAAIMDMQDEAAEISLCRSQQILRTTPGLLEKLTSLKLMDASNNSLSGEIPSS
ncbi:probable LRR receptor-like serine/threonine-protein kinase At4g36180 [Hibiscus syriacus]|uniref:probable LRR receptor-like serine/threonine-protein kinase At4g36180 n=1 Tax=Hibiscus syriacus TaxID=106335 RepID=UPI00192141C5|nr:probable LRR receptor-like serine/threonine-protein kinase At4g36180 [Hibiscus syriacus]